MAHKTIALTTELRELLLYALHMARGPIKVDDLAILRQCPEDVIGRAPRTHNPRLRRPMPYPVGHGARCIRIAVRHQAHVQFIGPRAHAFACSLLCLFINKRVHTLQK